MSDLWESNDQWKSDNPWKARIVIAGIAVLLFLFIAKLANTEDEYGATVLPSWDRNELTVEAKTNRYESTSTKMDADDSLFLALEGSLNYVEIIERHIDREYASMKQIYTTLFSNIPDSLWDGYINRDEDIQNFAHFTDTVTAASMDEKVNRMEAHISLVLCRRIETKLMAAGILPEPFMSQLTEKELYDKLISEKSAKPSTTAEILEPCLDTMYMNIKTKYEELWTNLPTNFWDGLTKKEEDLANFVQYYDTVSAKDLNERGVKSTGYITYDILQRIEYKLISCGLEESLINTAISREQYVQSLLESM